MQRRSTSVLTLVAILSGFATWQEATAAESVEVVKILSMYGSYSLDKDTIREVEKSYLDPACEAGFNTIELKILCSKIDFTNPDQFRRMQQLSDAANARGLDLMCYAHVNPWNGKRFPEQDLDLPPFVSEDGKVFEDKFSLIHWPTCRQLFDNAFQLAEISRDLDIKAVKLDLESIHNMGVSYDDRAWELFVSKHALAKDVPVTERMGLLKSQKLYDHYQRWFYEQMGKVVRRFESEMHRINPDLMLGMMPAHGGWFYEAFIKNLSVPNRPAIMDSWAMYNTSGYTTQVLEEQKRVKELNPENIFIPWFRINNYYPEDIVVQAYHAAFGTDGYSSWSLAMLQEDQSQLPHYLRLPAPHQSQEYWDAYGRANKAVRGDLNAGTLDANSIPYTPSQPVAPEIVGLDSLEFPKLKPVGTGRGKATYVVLRDQQVFYLLSRAGDDIKIDIRHLAGRGRATALHYILLDQQHRPLRHETVSPGATETFTVVAPLAGTNALVVTGGEAGSAWYGVRIHDAHAGLQLPAYIFYADEEEPKKFWLVRKDTMGHAKVKIATNENQVIAAQLNDEPVVQGSHQKSIVLDLPPNQKLHQLTLVRPQEIPEAKYVQDYLISVEGQIEPYLLDSSDRGIMRNIEK